MKLEKHNKDNENEHTGKIVRTVRKLVVLTIFIISYIITHTTQLVKRSNIFKEIAVAVIITFLAMVLLDMLGGLILTIKFYIEAYKNSKGIKSKLANLNFTVEVCQAENLIKQSDFINYINKLVCYEVESGKYCIELSQKQIDEISNTYQIYLRANKVYLSSNYIKRLIQEIKNSTNGKPSFILGVFTEKCEDFVQYTLFGNY